MSIFSKFVEASERAGRARAFGVLRTQPEDWLLRHNISPALLKQGVSAAPWSLDDAINSGADATEIKADFPSQMRVDRVNVEQVEEDLELDTAA